MITDSEIIYTYVKNIEEENTKMAAIYSRRIHRLKKKTRRAA